MSRHIPLPSQEELLKLYTYDPESGTLTHAVYKNSQAQVGTIAGHLKSDGYVTVQVKRKHYYISRVIWMLMTGNDPGELYVDHIDRDRSNNRWSNLRLATRPQQMWNRRLPGKGYYYDNNKCKWVVRFRVNGKRIWGGSHIEEADACAAAQQLRTEMHGEFVGEFALA